jgi:hypothetical protein
MEQEPQDARGFRSLADFLAVPDVEVKLEDRKAVESTFDEEMSAKEFALGILNSRQYRESILRRVLTDDLPPQMEVLLWNHAHGVPAKKVELTGANGGPISSVTRRIVDPVHPGEEPIIGAGESTRVH